MSQLAPRNDYVIVRRVMLGQTPGGVLTPDTSIEGVEHVIAAIGPKVENLNIGDKVLIIGTLGKDYGFLPNSKDLFVTKESNVVLVYKDDVIKCENPDYLV